MKKLRPLQARAVEQLRASLGKGFRRPLLKLPTGAGKTVIAAAIVQMAREKGKRVIFCVNAISLVDQTAQKFHEQGITEVGVIQGQHELTDFQQPVQIASVHTLMRRKVLPDADLVIIDECFSGDTPIETPEGSRLIQALKPGDVVCNATGEGVVTKVVTQFKKTIRLRLSNGKSVRVTKDHPFFTAEGWRKAGNLEVGTRLFGCQDVRRLWSGDPALDGQIRESAGGSGFPGAAFLLEVLREEAGEPDGIAGRAHADGHHATEDGAPAEIPGRKRDANGEAAGGSAEVNGEGMDGRAPGQDRISAWRVGVSDSLQNRHRESSPEDRDRGGRQQSQVAIYSGEGCEEAGVFGKLWVEDISRDECAGIEPVYNLRVSGHPSYFAAGVLVHNCHNWFQFYGTWMKSWNAIPFIGLSATPYTKGLGKFYDNLIIGATTGELIDQGWLSPFRVYAPDHPDLTKVRTLGDDYHEGDLGEAMDKAPLVANIVQTWLRLGENRPTLCYGVTRAHAQHIRDEFEAAGVPTGYMDSYTDLEERQQINEQFHSGALKVVCNVGVLTTGIDWDVRCTCLARPTKSLMLFQQIIGRGLRTAHGKDDLLVLDHSDTHLRLGFITDIDERFESLCDGSLKSLAKARERVEALPKECASCHVLKPPKVHACPNCGFAPKPRSEVEHIEGELRELQDSLSKTQRRNNRKYTADEKKRFYGELVWYALDKGFKIGWAAHKYQEHFGVWPNKHKSGPVLPTSDLTRGYIKHLCIKAAHSKRRAA